MSTPNQLATVPQEPSVALMLQGFIERGITAENVAAFAQLVELKERVDVRNAEKEFAAAFVDLQAEMPAVHALREVPNKDGSVRYRFAPYEEIMRAVASLLTKHGFTVSFNSRVADGRVTVACTLLHKAGHAKVNEFAVRIGGGPPGANETQADGAAKTYAKRGALCDALNIVIDHDTDGQDARVEGGPITQVQADTLRELCDDTKSDRAKFLAFAGAAQFEAISESRYADLLALLQRKIKK